MEIKEPLLPLGEDNGNQKAGVLCLANEARFTSSNYSEPLTTFGVGFREKENLQAELDAIATPVPVGRRFEFKAANNADEFLSEADDIRAIGAPFKRIESKGTSVNQKTHNKGLTVRLDRDEDLIVPGAEERAVGRIITRLYRNDLRRGYALLVAAATNTAKTWDGTSGKDPDQDVMTDLDTGGDARGFDSNMVVYGRTAWLKRLLAHRAQTVAGGVASSAIISPEELAAFLGVDKVLITKSRYQSTSSAKSKNIGGAYVLMYFNSQSNDKDDASNIKRFYTPTESGMFRVYREEHAKFVDVSVEHYSNLVITSSLGIRMFTIS
ncbi:MAG: hypothetical protein V2A34_02485 [Lentisphaerota bacterium]